jgi:methylase of polypeptide subunit release factors
MTSESALLDLIVYLKRRDYRFRAVTPATHARVLARRSNDRPTMRDLFGWNRPFRENEIEAELLILMKRAGILRAGSRGLVSALRVASLGQDLFLHSRYPTDERDAVFFGPDTYRFVRFVQHRWPAMAAPSVIDMGAGSGAGGIIAARLAHGGKTTLVDLNPRALRLAKVNALAARVAVELCKQNSLPASADIIIANPPYMMDHAQRTYRHGGELLGGAVALRWVNDALAKLNPGGSMLLYTGAAIVGGLSPLVLALHSMCRAGGAALEVEEIDPDVFGEELDRQAYREVERIAAIGAVIRVGMI